MQQGRRGATGKPGAATQGEVVPAGSEIPLSPELAKAARSYRAKARAQRTLDAYRDAWQRFCAWCEREGREPLPAMPETVAGWMVALADGHDGPPRAAATINAYLSAVISAHRAAGHVFDRKQAVIAETWAGISRVKAKQSSKRQVRPLLADDLRSLIAGMAHNLPADARDAALLALGWSAALRRSELVGLDWLKRSTGSGSVHMEEGKGLVVRLATSKGSQAHVAEIVVPCEDMPEMCEAMERWVKLAALQPGEPIFRPIDKGQNIRPGRLWARSVASIIKARIRALAQARGKTEAEAEELARQFSGHSMRAGYATTAGAADMPSYRIMQHTRHKSHEMVASYIREGQKWTNSGLKGLWKRGDGQ